MSKYYRVSNDKVHIICMQMFVYPATVGLAKVFFFNGKSFLFYILLGHSGEVTPPCGLENTVANHDYFFVLPIICKLIFSNALAQSSVWQILLENNTIICNTTHSAFNTFSTTVIFTSAPVQ